jgi:hypothetical protein
MLVVLLDEPTLIVFESLEEAVDYIEPIDAEAEIRAAFDEAGVPYRVEWIRPNQHGRPVLGVKMITQGEYRFVPAGPADRQGLLTLLEAHAEHIDPPAAKPEVVSLLLRLRVDS